jgi:hypothetical protein
MCDLFGHPIPEPAPPCDVEAKHRYRNLVLVVRNGVPVGKLAAIGIDPEPVIARMPADEVIGPNSTPLHPLDTSMWSKEVEELNHAMIRLFEEVS